MLIQIGGISVVYQWRSAVKFDGITSGISVDIRGIPVVLPVVSIGIQWYTSGFQWYTTGNQR